MKTSSLPRGVAVCLLAVVGLAWQPTPVSAQMDLRQAAGIPLPANDLPAGTVSVRVVRGSFANNLAGETVVFVIDGQERQMVTDAGGRAQVEGLRPGARVRARATVGAERLESQETTIGTTGIRFMLLATEGTPAAPVAAVSGSVFLGPESRIVIDYSNELLNVYYVVQVMNPGSAPVDIGGPLVIDLPTEARSPTLMEGATVQASVAGAHVTVRGPFQPGRTDVSVAFTMPFSGDTAVIEQRWPAEARPFTVFGLKTGNLDIVSPQLLNKQSTVQQGQALVVGVTPQLVSGTPLRLEVTGLPHRATWPRNVAFSLAAAISALGLWAAFGPAARRRTA